MADEKKGRGVSVSKAVTKAKKKGIRFDIEWNEHDQPIKEHHELFTSHLGVLVRMTIPITYDNWKLVPKALKDNLWDDLLTAFNIDERHKRWIMQKAGHMARQFRSDLRTKYLTDKDGNLNHHPPAAYSNCISQQDWEIFVNKCLDPEFQELSSANSKRASGMEYRYRRGRKAYADIEVEKIQESGLEVTQLPRHILWKAGRENREGKITDPKVQKVVDEIESLSQSVEQGEIDVDGRQDILARAMNRPEHPGRVRGVGFGVPVGAYFPKEVQRKAKDDDKKKIQRMEKMIAKLAKTVAKFKGQMNIQSSSEEEEEDEDAQPFMPPPGTSGKDSHNPTPIHIPMGIIPCDLYVSFPTYHKVAIGKVFNDNIGDEEMLIHTRPLPADHLKVGIDVVIEDNCPLPVPIEEACIYTTTHAVGTCVAWPSQLIKIHESTAQPQRTGKAKASVHTKESVAAPSKSRPTAAGNLGFVMKDNPYVVLMGYASQLGDDSILSVPMDMERSVFNLEPWTEMLGKVQIIEALHHSEIGASVITTYIRFLYENFMVPNGLTGRFSFISPHMTPPLEPQYAAEIIACIVNVLMAHREQNKLIMAPHNVGGHWILIAINPSNTESLYYLDSVGGYPMNRQNTYQIFSRAIEQYRRNIGAPRKKNVNWLKIKCPRQKNNVDCGYFVMRYMRDIILNNASVIPFDYFPNYLGGSYQVSQVQEVIDEWTKYMVTLL